MREKEALKYCIRKIIAGNFNNRDQFDTYVRLHPKANFNNHSINQVPASAVVEKTTVNITFEAPGIKEYVTPLLYGFIDAGVFDLNHINAAKEFRKTFETIISLDECVKAYRKWLKRNKDNYPWGHDVYNHTLIIPSRYISYLLLGIKDGN